MSLFISNLVHSKLTLLMLSSVFYAMHWYQKLISNLCNDKLEKFS